MAAIRANAAQRLSHHRELSLTVGATFLTLEAARLFVAGRTEVAAALIAALAVYALFAHPRAVTLIVVLLSCTIFLAPRGRFAVAGVQSDAAELLSFALIGVQGVLVVLVRGRRTVYFRGFVALIIAIVSGAVVAVLRGVPRESIIGNTKGLLFYLLILPFSLLFDSADARAWLERAVLWTAGIGSAVTIAAVAVGYRLEGRPGLTFDFNDPTQATRVRPALLALLFLATLLLLGRIVLSGATFGRLLLMGLFVCAWALSFNRSTWVALGIAVLVLLRMRPGPRSAPRRLAAGLALGTVVPLVFAAASVGAAGRVPQAVARRTVSIVDSGLVQSDSYRDRQREYDDAVAALRASPVFGVGTGGAYGARRGFYDQSAGRLVFSDRLYSHNSWLHLYLWLGLPGAVAAVILAHEVIMQVRRSRRLEDLSAGTRSVAAGASLFGAALEALFNPNLVARPSVVGLTLAFALAVAPSGRESSDATSAVSATP